MTGLFGSFLGWYFRFGPFWFGDNYPNWMHCECGHDFHVGNGMNEDAGKVVCPCCWRTED